MPLFPNATVTINRIAATPGVAGSSSPQPLYPNISISISPFRQDVAILPGGLSVKFDYEAVMDASVDVREGDRLTGYNPRNLNPAPVLVVRRVEEYLGVVPHWSVYCEDVRDGSLS